MDLNKYIISINREKRNTAGVKAPDDIVSICKELGCREYIMPCFPKEKNKLYQKAWLIISGSHNWKKLMDAAEAGSIVIYQHPMYGNRLAEKMIPVIQKRKNVKFIVLIHDLESLRGGIKGVINTSAKTNDIADNVLLKKFDVVICHNEHMRQYLIDEGFDPEKLISLEIFDYLTAVERVQKGKSDVPSIAIAGNLAIGKCAYIYNIFNEGNNSGLSANLYGINFREDQACKNMLYHGSYKPEELPLHMEGDFGLVWDGNSAETCAGNTGEYLKYNNPHKTSLYLASGMPVIVWSQAAIADFVLERGVGITVDSLYEIEEKIRGITEEEYSQMCERVNHIGKQIREGSYTKAAIKKGIEKCLA